MEVANLRIVVTLEIRTRISGGLMTKLSKEDQMNLFKEWKY